MVRKYGETRMEHTDGSVTRAASEQRFPRAPRARITVRKADFDKARKCDAEDCLIAVAVVRTMAEKGIKVTSVLVDVQTIRFSVPALRMRYTYLTPRRVVEGIYDFDRGSKFRSFSFNLAGSVQMREMLPWRGRDRKPAEQTDAQREARRPGLEAMHKMRGIARSTGNGTVPDTISDRALPVIPGNRRRTYGLRAFDRAVASSEEDE